MVFLAHRHAAAGDDQVGLGCGPLKSLAGRFPSVLQGLTEHHLAACFRQQSQQGVAIAVIDLSRPQWLSGIHQLVTGCENGDFQFCVHGNVCRTNGAQQAHFLGADPGARRQCQLALSQILATATDILAFADRPIDGDTVAANADPFLHDDRVRA